jgi:two-component system phosphate regulon response regulator PhoB
MNKLRKKVLIVDDDASIRDSIRLAIEEQEYVQIEVTESADVGSGIEMMKKIHPDIVILDLHLPDKSGFEFMDILNKDKSLANTKVIMITVDDTLANVFKAQDKGIGAYNFIGKPFNILDIQAVVVGLCGPDKT